MRGKIDIVPFTPELADEARSAWRKYGTGKSSRGSEFLRLLRLCAFEGFGSGEPLLFQGAEFTKTDVTAA